MENRPVFSFSVAKIVAAVAAVLAILVLLGVAAQANLIAWAVLVLCVAVILL